MEIPMYLDQWLHDCFNTHFATIQERVLTTTLVACHVKRSRIATCNSSYYHFIVAQNNGLPNPLNLVKAYNLLINLSRA
jgi:hypothetical protein